MTHIAKALAFSCLVSSVHSHMAISAYPQGLQSTEIFARDKATLNDAYRNPASSVCQGTSSGASQFTIAKDTKLFAKTTYGAGHDGGHCAWFISGDEKTWYKLNDKLDCTKGGQDQPHHVTIPANVPLSCGTKCTLAWFWTPRSSGGCEIYSDCFDITVAGATGGIESSSNKITTPLTCERISLTTGATQIYGPLMLSVDGEVPSGGSGGDGGDGGTPTNPTNPVDVEVDQTSGCTTYTVKAGDSLSAIASRFDIPKWQDIQALNNLADPNVLEVGQVLEMPGDCEMDDDGDGKTSGASRNAILLSPMVALVASFFTN